MKKNGPVGPPVAKPAFRRNKPSPWLLSQKMMFTAAVIVIMTVSLTMFMVLRLNLRLQTRRIENTLHELGEMVAVNPLVLDAFRTGQATPDVEKYLGKLVVNLHDLDVVTLADMNAKRIYHENPRYIGEDFVGGDESDALKGKSYFSRASGTLGEQMRYFCPVFDSSGEKQLGFVMVSALMTTIHSQRNEIYASHFRVMMAVLGIALLATWLGARRIKRTLLGFEPGQLSEYFLERVEVLNSLEEGIIAVDSEGYIILANRAATNMLRLHHDDIGTKRLDDLYPQVRIGEVLTTGQSIYNHGISFGDVSIICNRIPLKEDDVILGGVAILHNRTEVTRLAEELTGVNHMIDALRSNTHEFMNRLQVILGLLRIGDPKEAEKYIVNISREQANVISPVLQKIENKNLGALILGKMSHCRELDINFKLDKSSYIPSASQFLSGSDMQAIVENLVENAIETVNSKPKSDGDREVALLVYEDHLGLMITVDDTGEGYTPEETEQLLKGENIVKARHRSTGLRLVRAVVESNNGEMQIDSDLEAGTSVTVCFTRRDTCD
ncbi:MAG: ATP-binding protein [Pyramidobacter sp.]|jgi:two-component system sensor histidine kinase DctS